MAHASGRTVWIGLLFGLAVAVCGAYQQLKLPPVLPEMLAAYGYPRTLAGGFMSVFAVAGLALSLQIGRLMQVHGAGRFLLGAAALAAAGSGLVLAVPQSGWLVLAGRGLEGAAMAILAVAGPTLMTRNAGPGHQALAAALAATWIPLGGLIASAVTRLQTAIAPGTALWPSVFWVGIAFAALVAAATLLLARYGPGRGVDLAMPVRHRDAVAPDPARRAALILAGACFFLWATQNMAVLTWLPAYMTERHGVPAADAATLYALPIAMVALFNLVAIPILQRGVAISRLLVAALAGQAALLALAPLIPVAVAPWTGLAGLALYGALAGLTPTCLYGLPARILGGSGTGAGAFGILMTGRNLGVLCGPLAVAAALDLAADPMQGWRWAPPAVAAVTALAGAAAYRLDRRLARLAPAA